MINFNNFSTNNVVSASKAVKNIAFKQDNTQAATQPVANDSFQKSAATEDAKKSMVPSFSDPNATFKLKIGYINDFHGQLKKMERTIEPLKDCDVRFSGGDSYLGDERNANLNKAVTQYLNLANIEAEAPGNHEFDMSQKCFMDVTKDLNTKLVNANFRQSIDTPEHAQELYQTTNKAPINQRFVNSYVTNIKGENVGVIGVSPVDIHSRLSHPEYYTDCKVDNIIGTVSDVQKEADKFKQQGINKVVLLSHIGHAADQAIAKNTTGVDVIIGGHSHELVKDLKKGDNLLASKTGEPVVITQAGKDGNNFGILNVEFDKNGVIKTAQNNVIATDNYQPNLVYKKVLESKLGDNEKVGVIKSVVPQTDNLLTDESANANFVADAMKNELGTDIGLLNACNLRSRIETGDFTKLDAKMLSPFNNKMVIANVKEKDLVDAFKVRCKSFVNQNKKPGLFAVSGLKYSVSKSTGDLKSLSFVDKEGKENPIDINNPNPNKTYSVAADSFLLSGGDKVKALDYKGKEEKVFDFDKDKLVCDYVKHLNKPIEINQTGRVNIVD